MEFEDTPFPLPKALDPDLDRVRAYWDSLKRGEADMPFWDDVKISSLADLADAVMLIDVLGEPVRFRLNFAGRRVIDRYGEAINGRFLDELDRRSPLEYLLAQCSATVESRQPTFYRHAAGRTRSVGAPSPYSRLLLPMWGDGHIGMLLAAFAWL